MTSPKSSSKRHRLPSEEEKEKYQQDNDNDGVKKKTKKVLDDSQKIHLEIIEEFHKRNLEVPVHTIGKNAFGHSINYELSSLFMLQMQSIDQKQVKQIRMMQNIVKNCIVVYRNILIIVKFEIVVKHIFFLILSIN